MQALIKNFCESFANTEQFGSVILQCDVFFSLDWSRCCANFKYTYKQSYDLIKGHCDSCGVIKISFGINLKHDSWPASLILIILVYTLFWFRREIVPRTFSREKREKHCWPSLLSAVPSPCRRPKHSPWGLPCPVPHVG